MLVNIYQKIKTVFFFSDKISSKIPLEPIFCEIRTQSTKSNFEEYKYFSLARKKKYENFVLETDNYCHFVERQILNFLSLNTEF